MPKTKPTHEWTANRGLFSIHDKKKTTEKAEHNTGLKEFDRFFFFACSIRNSSSVNYHWMLQALSSKLRGGSLWMQLRNRVIPFAFLTLCLQVLHLPCCFTACLAPPGSSSLSGKADGGVRTTAGLLALLTQESEDPRPSPLYMAAAVSQADVCLCMCEGWGVEDGCSLRGERVEAEASGQRAGTEASLTERRPDWTSGLGFQLLLQVYALFSAPPLSPFRFPRQPRSARSRRQLMQRSPPDGGDTCGDVLGPGLQILSSHFYLFNNIIYYQISLWTAGQLNSIIISYLTFIYWVNEIM